MYKRCLDLKELVSSKSLLLLGPRQTGKSTLVRDLFPNAIYLNLAQAATFRELSSRPELLTQRYGNSNSMLIIDEAQKIPELFDEVQGYLDENSKRRVILTGSSARKLRRTGINLLPGRVWKKDLFPLVYPELGSARILDRINRGSLPGVIDAPNFKEELINYVGLYLDEEVRAEGLVRGIGDFGRFLSVAALYNAEQINFTNIANDTGIKLNTVRGYFQILEDTLIGHQLLPFRKTKLRKAVATPKFYFFDCGVVNALLQQFEIAPQSKIYGQALEHIIYQELRAYLSYSSNRQDLTYWRSHSKAEVDFVIGSNIGIEVKSKDRVTNHDEKSLLVLNEDLKFKHMIIVCNETSARRTTSGVLVLPVEAFLKRLWEGEFF